MLDIIARDRFQFWGLFNYLFLIKDPAAPYKNVVHTVILEIRRVHDTEVII